MAASLVPWGTAESSSKAPSVPWGTAEPGSNDLRPADAWNTNRAAARESLSILCDTGRGPRLFVPGSKNAAGRQEKRPDRLDLYEP